MDGLAVQEDGTLPGRHVRAWRSCPRRCCSGLGPKGRLLADGQGSRRDRGGHARCSAPTRACPIVAAASPPWPTGTATAAGLDGVLLDLGVSSPQLDVAERGFSFGKDGPLDMRMDPESGRERRRMAGARHRARDRRRAVDSTARSARAGASPAPSSPRRAEQPIDRTAQLADLIALGRCRAAPGKIHPATRSFQAIRIHINRELADLEAGLDAALARLKPGGRLAVISFHSLEDRIVKQFIARHAKAPPANRRMPVEAEFTPTLRLVGGAQQGRRGRAGGQPARAQRGAARGGEAAGRGPGGGGMNRRLLLARAGGRQRRDRARRSCATRHEHRQAVRRAEPAGEGARRAQHRIRPAPAGAGDLGGKQPHRPGRAHPPGHGVPANRKTSWCCGDDRMAANACAGSGAKRAASALPARIRARAGSSSTCARRLALVCGFAGPVLGGAGRRARSTCRWSTMTSTSSRATRASCARSRSRPRAA